MDAVRRELERVAVHDPVARAALAQLRTRLGQCPHCGKPGEDEELENGCCLDCYLKRQQAGQLTQYFDCADCPAVSCGRATGANPAAAESTTSARRSPRTSP
jgi:hypothetical protein